MRSMLRTLSAPVRGFSTEKSDKVPVSLAAIQGRDDDQIDILGEFKKAVKCLDIPNDLELDEFYYMKWLRARGYNIEKAKEMLTKHLEWRESCIYLDGLTNYIAPNEVLNNLKWNRLGNDIHGRPIVCALLGKLDIQDLSTNGYLEDFKQYVHKIFEIFQAASDEQRRINGYGKVIGILDMDGFTFAKAMNIDLLQCGMYFARIFEANYPELLHRIFFLNTSWFFTTAYNACKVFLAQETIKKIQIYGFDQAKYFPALEETIPFELIPEEYGGPGISIEDFDVNP